MGKLFCDGFKITKPEYFNEIEEPMKWVKLRLSKYFVIKSIKDSGTYVKGYFVRLDDKYALFDDEFFINIFKMMNEIRDDIK